ncbi:MAG TPA: radical SAM protein [Ruminiclostridium sp.]|nr:radical SAM protein [Ruminiclostridium sp.]
MQLNIELFDKKSIAIFGVNRYQRDFEYIFDFLNINFYIDDNMLVSNQSKPVFTVNELSFDKFRNVVVIICEKNKEAACRALESFDLQYGKDFIYAEDIFSLLDNDGPYLTEVLKKTEQRKLAVWGTGDTWLNFRQKLCEFNINLYVDVFIDKDPKKAGKMLDGKKVVDPSQIAENAKDYYIIHANMYYRENKPLLTSWGLKEKDDFISHEEFLTLAKRKKPSELLKETIFAEEIEGPDCDLPFKQLTAENRELYCCSCSRWVNFPVGDLAEKSLDENWNSIYAKIFRLSIINRTYSFCNKKNCPKFFSIDKYKSENNVNSLDALPVPETLNLAIDYTCNLYCSSCRSRLGVAKGSDLDDKMAWADKIIESGWLEKVPLVIMAGSGEVFFSKVYRKLLFPQNSSKRDSINILTNGTLMDSDILKTLSDTYKNIFISISIDAASEQTYKILRRGGDWDRLQRNLETLSFYRKSSKVQGVRIRMVVQKQNYREMIDFVKMAQKFSFDEAFFTRILNWGTYSDKEFAGISMFENDGTPKPELIEIQKDPIFNDPAVVLEF